MSPVSEPLAMHALVLRYARAAACLSQREPDGTDGRLLLEHLHFAARRHFVSRRGSSLASQGRRGRRRRPGRT